MRSKLINGMMSLFGDDQRRIKHALYVLEHAEVLLNSERGDALTVQAAAVLHDIGIHEAERKYDSCSGKYQEIEGPPIAKNIMENLGVDSDRIEHVCKIIANHHTARNIDTPEFRILWDADWLVNIPDEYPQYGPEERRRLIGKVFRTQTGRQRALELYG